MTSKTSPEASTTTIEGAALPRVTKPGNLPIKSWAPELDAGSIEQATNLSNLQFAIRHVALMPDAHMGYGMPIGGVLFADKNVVPYAIGVDIGCGVALVETDMTVETLSAAELAATLKAIAAGVPVGTSSQKKPVEKAAALEEIGLELPGSIEPAWFGRAVHQLGTLGSGNHFLELQRDEAGGVFVMPTRGRGASARRSATRSTSSPLTRPCAGARSCPIGSWRTSRSAPRASTATGRR
ncbi:MAG: RtcB family protein [Chloroflexi bacterium]|nr:RtcB family protein [Chloroflexota bacterium]